MTSNLGSEQLLEKTRTRGSDWTKESILDIVEPILKAHFRPEFLNRLDDILPFLPLHEQDMEKIVLIQLERVVKRLQEKNIKLSWDNNILAYLAEKGYDPFFGARPLKRLIQQEVINLLSNAILKGDIKADAHITLSIEKSKGEKGITFTKAS